MPSLDLCHIMNKTHPLKNPKEGVTHHVYEDIIMTQWPWLELYLGNCFYLEIRVPSLPSGAQCKHVTCSSVLYFFVGFDLIIPLDKFRN